MKSHFLTVMMLALTLSVGAYALTGSGDSATGLLETVSPSLNVASIIAAQSMTAEFSEPMLGPAVTLPHHYALSGLGVGTLTPMPFGVSGGPTSYTLEWAAGEMRDGVSLTLTAVGLQDLLGNPIRPDANHASATGVGVAPVFSDLLVTPLRASAGETVTISFVVSEALDGAPMVTVNGNEAVVVDVTKTATFTCAYVVQDTDPPGMATLVVSGFDLAGNLGTLGDTASLEILENESELPVYGLPAAVLMLLAAAAVLMFRYGKRRALLLLVVIVAPIAAAQGPIVSNVAFIQQDNGAGGTEILITYDLDAPNGPCDVSVWLSKDAGADGFVHPATSVSGDLVGVAAGAGHAIVWDIAADYPDEHLPDARIRLVADDGFALFTLTYTAGPHGSITGDSVQDVLQGHDGTPVEAAPDPNYHFVNWSDGSSTNPRQDMAVNNNVNVTANFAIDTHDITCVVSGNGTCTANPATVNHGDTSEITVTPAAGWHVLSIEDSEEGAKPGSYTTTPVTSDRSVTVLFDEDVAPTITAFSINNDDATTMALPVVLDNTVSHSPTEYMASESPAFTDASWQPYDPSAPFTLSFGVGTRTVYFKTRNAFGESPVANDTIFLTPRTVPVGAGTFPMGRNYEGGWPDQVPVHPVTLSGYEIGRFEVTCKEFCDVYNWALSQGYVKHISGYPYTGSGSELYAGSPLQMLIYLAGSSGRIGYSGGLFHPRTFPGFPEGTEYAMDTHPIGWVTWYGAAAYCNWLSEWQGLTPCYDMTSVWTLSIAPPAQGGYRLPTEAEWERAAAWDGFKHWKYGYISDSFPEISRSNVQNSDPLGIDIPLTFRGSAPVGWYNGLNVNPNGNVATVDSPSPVGAYDMTGNVGEWCTDWYRSDYYSISPLYNPIGPAAPLDAEYRRVYRSSGAYAAGYPEIVHRWGRGAGGMNYTDVGFRLARSCPSAELVTFVLNNDAPVTASRVVTLNNVGLNSPTEYMASESPLFEDASWRPYTGAPEFTLSAGLGMRTVYFKVRNEVGTETSFQSDSIFLAYVDMALVEAGAFIMGNSNVGDDATYGGAHELPAHPVTLSAYRISKNEVTNKAYCDMLNWALAQGYLKDSVGASWEGSGDIYAGGASALNLIISITDMDCNIAFLDGTFVSKTRIGLPDSEEYSMALHPMVHVSWYGALAFCNWLSEGQGVTTCYDMNAPGWPLTIPPPIQGGYRLSTEAEWECAAAWDGVKHWIYGFTSDTLTGNDQCNTYLSTSTNPLGLTTHPYTSPVAWFNGVNVSPNGNVTTTQSISPVGAYDMSGNVAEWCQDWYLSTYYDGGAMTDPVGPVTGSGRVLRGGQWLSPFSTCRSADRKIMHPSSTHSYLGFRLVRSEPSTTITAFAINNGDDETGTLLVTLNSTYGGMAPTECMASESEDFDGASWQPYASAIPFSVTSGTGPRTVYFKVRNSSGETSEASDDILLMPEMVVVEAGAFIMGRTMTGDDALYGLDSELPQHSVWLDTYQIGKYEITNKQYCDVLNWAKERGYLLNHEGNLWTGTGLIHGGNGSALHTLGNLPNVGILYDGDHFYTNSNIGSPGSTTYPLDTHPVTELTWYGAVAFCNWLSVWHGLTPCYDMSAPNWPLVVAPPTSAGYRLPTEAEWERAAAWDGTQHCIYGFISDTLSGQDRCNYREGLAYANPLGFVDMPYTAPTGWFNGVNISPNGNVVTLDSPSPVGCYDMSGNVGEWCNDWFSETYYSVSPAANPTGPQTGSKRSTRGGCWDEQIQYQRSSSRYPLYPNDFSNGGGFRIAKS